MTTKPKTVFFLKVPEPCQVRIGTNRETGEGMFQPYSLAQYVEFLADTDEHFCTDMPGVRRANRLVRLFKKNDIPGDIVEVIPDEFDPLAEAAEAPSGGMPTIAFDVGEGRQARMPVGRVLQTIADAIKDATQEDPADDAGTETKE